MGIGLPFLAAAGYYDLKTNEIPDLVSYGFFACSTLLVILLALINASWTYVINGAAGFAVGLVIGLAFYYIRFWGGGDAKLFFGMGVLFGGQGLFNISITLLIALAVYLFVSLSIMFARHKRELKNKIINQVVKGE